MRRIMARSKKLLGGRQSSTVATPSSTVARTPSRSSSTWRPYRAGVLSALSVSLGAGDERADRAELLTVLEHGDGEVAVQQERRRRGQLGDATVEEELTVALWARPSDCEMQQRHPLTADHSGEQTGSCVEHEICSCH